MSVEAPVKKFAIKDYKSDLHNDWCPGSLSPDMLIAMADGTWKEIAGVAVDDQVVGHDGKAHRVTEVMSHWHPAPLHRLTVLGGRSVDLTDDHPMLIVRHADSIAEWAPAREVRAGDLVVYPINATGMERQVVRDRSAVAVMQRTGTAVSERLAVEPGRTHLLLRVVSNVMLEYEGYVHNFEVEGVHSYVSSVGALHNCGDFGILTGIQMALASMGLDPDKVAVFSGIGCSGKTPHYIKAYGFHTLHGRVLPVATGARLVNRDVTVIALGGDGDGYGIGAGYFVNSGRRNVDMAYLVHNNNVYGLTKGQASPTLRKGKRTKSMPEEAIQDGINPIAMAVAAGYTFIARGYALEPKHLAGIIQRAIEHKGAALVDVLQTCPTYNDLYTKEWYEGADLPEKKSRLYKLEATGFDPVVHDVTDEQEIVAKKAAAVVKSYEKEPIPIGIYYQAELPTYEDALNGRIPALAEKPLVDIDTFHRDVNVLLEAMR